MARKVVEPDPEEIEIQHLEGWMSIHEIAARFVRGKTATYWWIWKSGRVDHDKDVRVVAFSAAHPVYLVREEVVEAEVNRRAADAQAKAQAARQLVDRK